MNATQLHLFEAGVRPVHVIGYDNSTADCRRRAKADRLDPTSCPEHHCQRWYPLQDCGWDRAACVERIVAAGLPVPVKSACFFCPASKPWEVAWLAAEHPDLYLRAVALERNWLNGKHGAKRTTCEGLGFRFSWESWGREQGVLEGDDQVNRDRARELAAAEMPDTAGTVQLTMRGQVLGEAAA